MSQDSGEKPDDRPPISRKTVQLQTRIELIEDLIKRTTEQRTRFTYASLLYGVLAAVGAFFAARLLVSEGSQLHRYAWLLSLSTFLLFLLLAGFVYYFLGYTLSVLHRKVDVLQEEKDFETTMASVPAGVSAEYLSLLVGINLKYLTAYYNQVQLHCDKSFMVSITAGVIGFLMVIVGIAYGLANDQSVPVITYVSSAAGVITEFISAVFFYLYSKTVRQMKEYHDSLLDVQNILLSMGILEKIKSEDSKANLMSDMLRYILSRNPAEHSSKVKPS